jgi:hypothetical protein
MQAAKRRPRATLGSPNTSPVCPHCQQVTESVERALVEYKEVYAFWSRFYQVFKFPQYSRSDMHSILSLYIARNQRRQLSVKACSHPDGPLWCSLARALLERHLSTTRKVPSDLLAGSVSQWHLKDALPLWRNLLRVWDALRGSMHPTIRPPLGVAMAVSASMVFRRSEDDRSCLATQAW